jgi:uncharacterized membrane protein
MKKVIEALLITIASISLAYTIVVKGFGLFQMIVLPHLSWKWSLGIAVAFFLVYQLGFADSLRMKRKNTQRKKGEIAT